MKNKFLIGVSALFLASCSTTSVENNQVEETNIKVKKTDLGAKINLFNQSISIEKSGGARISSLTLGGNEFLSLTDVNESNWGSTFWTSPQSEWGWPPPKTYDGVDYSMTEEDGVVTLTGEKDSVTNYIIEKQITANEEDTSFVIVYTIHNKSDSTKSVAPWEITRVPPNGLTFFPGDSADYTAPYTTIAENGMVWFDYKNSQIQPLGNHNKLIGNGREGWLAHINGNMILVKVFPDLKEEESAPDEGEIEVYANPDKSYIELEPQGPYVELKSGEKTTWEVKWILRELPSDIDASAGNEALIAYVRALVKQ